MLRKHRLADFNHSLIKSKLENEIVEAGAKRKNRSTRHEI